MIVPEHRQAAPAATSAPAAPAATAEVTLADLQADASAIIIADANGAFRNIIPTQPPKVWVKGLIKLDIQ